MKDEKQKHKLLDCGTNDVQPTSSLLQTDLQTLTNDMEQQGIKPVQAVDWSLYPRE